MAPWARRLPWLFNLAGVRAVLSRLRQAALAAEVAQRHVPRDDRCRCRGRDGRDLRRHLLEQLRARDPACRAARAGGGRPSRRRRLADARRARAVLRPHLSGDRPGRQGAGAKRERLLEALPPFVGARRAGGRPRAVVPVHLARRVPGAGPRRGGAQDGATTPSCSRNSWRARRRRAGSRSISSRCRRRPRCCTAIATRRRSAR